MFDGEGDPDYKGSLEELEQNLLLQQLDEIVEAFESKEGVREGGNNEKRTTWNSQSFHKTNRVDGARTRQKSRLGSSNVQIQKTSQKHEGAYGSETYKLGRRNSRNEEFAENEWDYLMNPRWYFGDKKPRKWGDDKILRARLLLSDYRNGVVSDYIPLEAEYELCDILNELYEDEDPEENW